MLEDVSNIQHHLRSRVVHLRPRGGTPEVQGVLVMGSQASCFGVLFLIGADRSLPVTWGRTGTTVPLPCCMPGLEQVLDVF